MRLLITTQAVDQDDPALGFFHSWLAEFAEQCERVHVICLREGTHHLPANVTVHSLGKSAQGRPASGWGRGIARLTYMARFYKYIWSLRHEYDAVFVHMNPVYVVLGGPLWRFLKKHIALWYVHRQVGLLLRLAVPLTNVVFTASEESMRIDTPKRTIVGHGIDTGFFSCAAVRKRDGIFRILSIGRITPIKNCGILIEAARMLKERGAPTFEIVFVGAPVYNTDRAYAAKLHARVREAGLAGVVHFMGAVGYRELPALYCGADATVNLAPTGGSDKVVLESLSCGIPVFASNEAFRPLFAEQAGRFLFRERNAADLADMLGRFLEDRISIEALSARVREQYGLSRLVAAICSTLAIEKMTRTRLL